jgi:deazaflavin-dependent oxidoreductase (nitroreductase family)
VVEKTNKVHPPQGIFRWLARLPIWLYHLGLGWLLSERFLLLIHTGRVSGLQRQVVLEVVQHDKNTDVYYVAVGFGEASDWYQNVIKTPDVMIYTGRRRLAARAQRVPAQMAEQVIVDYAHRHPYAMRGLARLMGYRVDGTQAGYAALGRQIPILALQPELNAT